MFTRSLFIAGGISTAVLFIAALVLFFFAESLRPFVLGSLEIRLIFGVFLVLSIGTAVGLGCDLVKRRKSQSGYRLHVLNASASVVVATFLINLAIHLSVAFAHLWNYPIAVATTWLLLVAVVWLGVVTLGFLLKNAHTRRSK